MAAIKFKNAFYWLIGLLALSLAVLSVVLSFLDWNKYRDTLSELATAQLGMQVELAGNVSVALFPRPNISAETVKISPLVEGFSEPVATAEKISLRLGFSGIFDGKFSIQSLLLEGMTAALEEDSQGTWKLRGWISEENSSETAVPGIDLSRLEIVNATVDLTPYGNEARSIEKLSLKLHGNLPEGPLNWDGGFEYLGEKLTTSGRLKPVESREETSLKSIIEFGGNQINVSGRFSKSGDMIGRVQIDGENFASFVPSITRLLEVGTPTHLPQVPFSLDFQMDKKASLVKLESKGLSMGSTQGRADITLVQKETGNHLTGVLALGVIDLDEWALVSSTIEAETVDAENLSGLTGGLDITIEGIQNNKGIGQRIDVALVFTPDGAAISHLQALLPGAATVKFDGKLQASVGTGTIAFDIGNLPDLLSWVGTDLPNSVPPGRLTTASGRGELDLREGVWAIRGIEGLVDTTKVNGEVSGDNSGIIPSHVKLNLSKLNLNAFGNQRNTDNPIAIPGSQNIALDLSVEQLAGFNAQFNEARFIGSLQSGVLTVDHLRLERDRGSLQLEGRFEETDNGIAGQVIADYDQWDMPITGYFVKGLRRYLVSAGTRRITGSLSGNGSLEQMRVNLDAFSGDNELVLSGEVGLQDNGLSQAALQGGIKHKNVAGLFRMLEMGNYNRLPAQLTFLLEKQSSTSPLQTRITGDFAGGKLQADIEAGVENTESKLSFTHENIRQLERFLGTELAALDRGEGLSTSLVFQEGLQGRTLDVEEVRNGQRTIVGNASVDNNNRVTGQFSLAGFQFMEQKQADAAHELSAFIPYLQSLEGYEGRISLDLNDILISGQRVSASEGLIELTGQVARVNLGQGASMNGAPLAGQASVKLDGTYPLDATMSAGNVSLSALLEAQGLDAVLALDGAGDLELKGELIGNKDLLSSLEGSGNFSASAGRLAFLDVTGLQRSMSQATSGKAFLQTIGGLLRQGNTPVSNFTGKFSLVGGVLLVEEARADGAWGRLALDGQVNIISRLLNIKGSLALSAPRDVPEVPVSYNGTFDAPNAQWSSRLFERFVIAGIERRLRAGMFDEQEERERQAGTTPENTGTAVLSRALSLLEALRAQQEKQKQEAAKKTNQAMPNSPDP